MCLVGIDGQRVLVAGVGSEAMTAAFAGEETSIHRDVFSKKMRTWSAVPPRFCGLRCVVETKPVRDPPGERARGSPSIRGWATRAQQTIFRAGVTLLALIATPVGCPAMKGLVRA